MRPNSLPKLLVKNTSPKMAGSSDARNSPYCASNHSRESSGASDNYSPLTPTSSLRDHSRFPSSSSSLATTPPMYEHPDSPTSAAKPALDDLVEDPTEREDEFELCDVPHDSPCRCKVDSCYSNATLTGEVFARSSFDYDLADGFCSDGEVAFQDAKRRRGSGDSPVQRVASRFGHRLPSLTKRFKEKMPTTAVNRQGVRSAPPSRTPSRTASFRMPSLTKSLMTQLETYNIMTPPQTPVCAVPDEELALRPTAPLEIAAPVIEEPIDRQALASTPLLPPSMMERRDSDSDSVKSPLQSPTVAGARNTFSFVASPETTPNLHPVTLTPPLSSKPSTASFGMAKSGASVSSLDIPPIAIYDSDDKWADVLGHANFTVYPEPYMPEVFDKSTCKQLLADWESARRQYMAQAVRTREHYGPTSQVFKLTEQKWTEIDAQWRKFHDGAVQRATAKGEAPIRQTLAEPAPLTKIPSFDGPGNSGKFPRLDESDIVGPMVQYAKVQQRPSKRSTFIKFFGDLRLR